MGTDCALLVCAWSAIAQLGRSRKQVNPFHVTYIAKRAVLFGSVLLFYLHRPLRLAFVDFAFGALRPTIDSTWRCQAEASALTWAQPNRLSHAASAIIVQTYVRLIPLGR